MKKILIEEEKKKKMYNVMVEQYKMKEEMRMQEEIAERQELEKINQYQSRLDQRDKRQKLELAQKEKEK